jgi:hypothetical protein
MFQSKKAFKFKNGSHFLEKFGKPFFYKKKTTTVLKAIVLYKSRTDFLYAV